MNKLWTEITAIADKTGTIASGDTACGFANTAMVLAEKKYIPRVFAATVRVVSAVRSLVAAECGAKGPHKDCGYEGVYVKAIAGTPISMEEKHPPAHTVACRQRRRLRRGSLEQRIHSKHKVARGNGSHRFF